jgi:formylglycine-generating enzyme required for sulfatase activity
MTNRTLHLLLTAVFFTALALASSIIIPTFVQAESGDTPKALPGVTMLLLDDTWSGTAPVTGMKFAWVPGGCYMMGCGSWTVDCEPNEYPAHEVCLDGFWIGKYEVTQGQWTQIMGSNPSHFNEFVDNFPVEQVSWDDIQEFITQLNSLGSNTFRLPTEAEWEYAARSGGREEKYAGGDDLDSLGWYLINNGSRTRAVGTKTANGLGIYDMSGNVWEWVSDWYHHDYYSSDDTINPQGPEFGSDRVFRGGSWNHPARFCRAAYRNYITPGFGNRLIGFRLALSPSQQ